MSNNWVAPWTVEQVLILRKWQESRAVHPYTCANRNNSPHPDERDTGVLIPTLRGWICPWCGYTQNWAHSVDKDGLDFAGTFWAQMDRSLRHNQAIEFFTANQCASSAGGFGELTVEQLADALVSDGWTKGT